MWQQLDMGWRLGKGRRLGRRTFQPNKKYWFPTSFFQLPAVLHTNTKKAVFRFTADNYACMIFYVLIPHAEHAWVPVSLWPVFTEWKSSYTLRSKALVLKESLSQQVSKANYNMNLTQSLPKRTRSASSIATYPSSNLQLPNIQKVTRMCGAIGIISPRN